VLVRQEGTALPTVILVTTNNIIAHAEYEKEMARLTALGANGEVIEHILSLTCHQVQR
jgi:hypothetical protein